MSDPNNQSIGKLVRINRIFPDDLPSHFVSHVVVQHQPDHFILSFFEVWPPVIVEETEEARRRAAEQIESVDAKCVARLVVTPSRMEEIVAVISENLEKSKDKIEQASIKTD
ncbi:MAG: DUF3467 domain-containing protein [Acidobacteriota bacterium]